MLHRPPVVAAGAPHPVSAPDAHRPDAIERLAGCDAAALLATVRALRAAAQAGAANPLLQGRKLGLLCAADDAPDALRFRRAAEALGAHVAHIRHGLSGSSTPQEVAHTSRLLGRLYDALECQGMVPALVQPLRADAGIPVYDFLAAAVTPEAERRRVLGADADLPDSQHFLLQALLVNTIA